MFKIDPRQDGFISSEMVYSSVISERHILVRIENAIDFTFIDEMLKDTYSPDNGRPTTNYPSRMLKALWLETFYNLSDRDVADRANVDLAIKWFLGYNINEKPFEFSALSGFRDRLGEEGCKEAFFRINEQIQDAGFINPGQSQTIDATHVLSKTAHLTPMKMIYRGIMKLLQEVRRLSPELEIEIRKEVGFEGDITEIPKEYGMSDAERLDRLTRLVLLAEALTKSIDVRLIEIPDGDRKTGVGSTVEVIRRIISEQTVEETSENGKTKRTERKKKDKPKDRIANPIDPDARHGHKTSKKPFLGYKVSLTQNEDEIVTNVEVDPGNMVDGEAQIPMTDELEERQGKRPKKMIGDKAYGDGEVRHEQKENGTQVSAPLKKPFNRTGKLPSSEFNYDPKTGEVTCPNGKTARRVGYNKTNHSTMYQFSPDDCGTCPMKDRCTNADARHINISDYITDFREAADYNKTEEYKLDMKRRSGHERKNAEMKKKHGMERARYWGIPKVRIQAYMTAMVVNVKRFVKLLSKVNEKVVQAV